MFIHFQHLRIIIVYISVNFLLQIFASLSIIKLSSCGKQKLLDLYLTKPFYSAYKYNYMFIIDMLRKIEK